MRKLSISLLLITNGWLAASGSPLPFRFERFGAEEKFVSRAPGFNLLVSRDEAVFALEGRPGAIVRMTLEGAAEDATVAGEEQLPGRANYFVGRDRSSWRTNVEQFGRVRVREVLPHTDIVYYGNPKQPEYDLVLRPGADVAKIRLRFTGAAPEIQPNGDLLLKTAAGEIVEHQPLVEQDGKRVEGRFRALSDGSIGFIVGGHDPGKELRIDPSITYSTYLGGTSEDSPNAIATDAAGNTYIAGSTSSFNFPVSPGALQTIYPGTFETIAFVAKLNAAGTGLVYATFLGGSGIYAGDSANAIAVDGAGNVYIGGATGSANFPVTAGALSTTLSGPTDGFVAKINASGTALVYSTFLGGSGQDSVAGIAVDSSGDAYATGSTSSTNFPVISGAPQSILKSANDAFVAKLNPAGAHLLYSTYLGGSAEDDAYAIAVDSSGNAYVAGTTASSDFPVTTAAYKKTIGPAAVAFLAKVNAAGTGLTYATFLGGTGGDAANAIALDSAGDVFVAGTTYSADFPTTAGVFAPAAPGLSSYGHAFVSEINPAGAALVYSTFLGGASSDGANGLAIDASGDAIVTGFTDSSNFPVTSNPVDSVANYNPAAFIAKLNPTATVLLYSTLLGASGSTVGQAVAVDSTNHAYVVGYTNATTLPTSSGAFQTANGAAGPDASTGFLMKLDLGSATACALSFSPASANLRVAGGSLTTSVTAPAGCAWEAIAGTTWFTVNAPSSGVGSGSVTVTAGSNGMSLSARTGSLAAGGATFTLTQSAGSCTAPQFYPASQTFGQNGGTGSVAVSIPPGCAVTAATNSSWITIASGANATGDDLVTFSVSADVGASRTGSITIAGISYPISQAGPFCATSLTPTNSGIAAGGGSFPAILVAPSGCTWMASSSASWLTVSPTSGTGNATLTVSAGANNTGATLNANVTASGFSLPVIQTSNSGVPSGVSITPASGSGTTQVFTAVYSDTAGAAALSRQMVIIDSSLTTVGACAVIYDTPNFFLINDAGTTVIGPLAAGGSLANSQCSLSATGTSVNNSGISSAMNFALSFANSFAGPKSIYMFASDTFGSNTGYPQRGTFTVGSGLPSVVSVTPSAGSGTTRVFTAVYSDTAGAAALSRQMVIIDSSLTTVGACAVIYDTPNFFLINDAGTTVIGPLAAGGSLANSQCSLSATGTSVNNSGISSAMNLALSFANSFAGPKSIYMFASDTFGSNTGYPQRGTFTVP